MKLDFFSPSIISSLFFGIRVGLFGHNHVECDFVVKDIFSDWGLTRHEGYDHSVKRYFRPIKKIGENRYYS